MSEYITLKEAAKISGYHQDYLSQLIRSKKIVGRKLGKEWLTTKKSLAKYLANQGKDPAVTGALRLSWWQRNPKAAAIIFFVLVFTAGVWATLQFEEIKRSFVAGDVPTSKELNSERVVVATSSQDAEEFVVTTYSIDDGGEVEISVTQR